MMDLSDIPELGGAVVSPKKACDFCQIRSASEDYISLTDGEPLSLCLYCAQNRPKRLESVK